MNFVVKLDPFLETNGLEHVSTTYDLYSDKEKINLIESITDADKLFLSLNTDIPIGETYYVVATRHFNLPNIDYSSEVFEIVNNGEEINNMILIEPVVIEKPTAIINREIINASPGDTFTLKTSIFRGRGDGHTHTHWIVYDNNGIIFIKLKDMDNKTSIELPKSILSNKNKITFRVIHCSNNVESPIGEYTVNFNRVNFELESQLVNVPLSEYKLLFRKIDSTKPMRLTKINLIDSYDNLIRVYDVVEQPTDTNTVTIPEEDILSNSKLKIQIYCYDEANVITRIDKTIIPITDSLDNQYIADYEYLNIIEPKDYSNVISKDCVGDIVNGNIWLPVGQNIIKYDGNVDAPIGALVGANLLTNNADETYINYMKTSHLLIDTYDSLGKPTFMVYKHDLAEDTFSLLHVLTRDESKTVAHTNNMIQMSLEEFIYNPYGTNKLFKYNYKTNVLTELAPIPKDITGSALVKLEDGRILVIGNVDHLTIIYRPTTNDYIDSVSIVPADFIGVDLKTVELVNRDTLIFTNAEQEVNKVMYFDRTEYTLTALDITLGSGPITVMPMNGYIGLGRVVPINAIDNIPEHTTIELYK